MNLSNNILDYINDMRKAHTSESIICDHDIALTYPQILQRAQCLADALLQSNIKPGTVIGIYLPRSMETIIAILATILIDCAYMPIDMRSPPQRVKYILEDAIPSCVITVRNLIDNIPNNTCGVFDITSNKFHKHPNSIANTIEKDVLYVMYTSGSTGLPKGVLGTHIGLINRIAWMQSAYPILEHDVCGFNTAPAFVDSVAEIFSPISAGANLHIISHESSLNLEIFAKNLYSKGVTRLLLGPTILQVLLQEVADIKHWLSHVTFLAVSGEELTIQVAQKFRQTFPNLTFVNLYGSTEVSADALYYEIPFDLKDFDRIPIGSPITNMQVSLIPEDHLGEICLSGLGIAKGYLNDSNEFQKFVVEENTGNIIYKTGDLGYFDKNKSSIMYLGRADDQIKINGQKIHLKEIERIASQNKTIKDVAVVVSDSVPQKIIMYVVSNEPFSGNIKNELKDYMLQHVPEYMVPHLVVVTENIPKNINGKKDYILMHQQANQLTHEIKTDSIVSKLIAIYKDLFRSDSINLDTDFFEIGGNSIIAAVLSGRINKLFNITMDITKIYELATVQNISNHVEHSSSIHVSAMIEDKIEGIRDASLAENAYIFFPPLTGYSHCYTELLKRINQFKTHLLDEDCIAPALKVVSLKDMALEYAKYITNNVRASELRLIGWSFGGVVAHQCATYLQQMGEQVQEIILLDSYNPTILSEYDLTKETQEVFKHINFNIIDFDAQDIKSRVEKNIQLLWKHVPSYSNVDITLVKASSYNYASNDLTLYPDNGWLQHSGKDVSVVKCDKDHFDILDGSNISFLLSLIQPTTYL